MTSSTLRVHPIARRRFLGPLALAGGCVLALAGHAAAQPPPPSSGVVSQPVVEGIVETQSMALHTIVVTTVDGARHLFHYTKDLLVHGSKAAGEEGLRDLRQGSTVVVHYTVANGESSAQEIDRIGEGGLAVTEGVVIRVDRKRKEIVLKFDNGKTETLQLTDRVAAGVGMDVDRAAENTTRVAVYYTDEAGRKVVHFFKKVTPRVLASRRP